MVKKTTIIMLAIGLVAAAAGIVTAADTIKIGVNAPLTGFAASDGKSSTEGAKLAVNQINAAGGVLGKKIANGSRSKRGSPATAAVPICEFVLKVTCRDARVVSQFSPVQISDVRFSRRWDAFSSDGTER